MKICGIIGGLGPSSTADLYRSITRNTPAGKDQDHLRLIIDSHPQIPDRTEALLYGGESPEKYFRESINILKNAGADFLVCPCNTAHVFLRPLSEQENFVFIDMIEETIKYLKKNNIQKAGLLSTSGTAMAGIYEETAMKYGIKIISPDESGIGDVMEAVYGKEGIKAGERFEQSPRNKSLLTGVVKILIKKGAEAIILGCSELPLCITQDDTEIRLINPTDILAQAVVEYALA